MISSQRYGILRGSGTDAQQAPRIRRVAQQPANQREEAGASTSQMSVMPAQALPSGQEGRYCLITTRSECHDDGARPPTASLVRKAGGLGADMAARISLNGCVPRWITTEPR